jgi:hypothetical protein
MEHNSFCDCSKDHETHICQLKKQMKMQEVLAMKKDPSVYCLLCEELASSADHVCSPVEL